MGELAPVELVRRLYANAHGSTLPIRDTASLGRAVRGWRGGEPALVGTHSDIAEEAARDVAENAAFAASAVAVAHLDAALRRQRGALDARVFENAASRREVESAELSLAALRVQVATLEAVRARTRILHEDGSDEDEAGEEAGAPAPPRTPAQQRQQGAAALQLLNGGGLMEGGGEDVDATAGAAAAESSEWDASVRASVASFFAAQRAEDFDVNALRGLKARTRKLRRWVVWRGGLLRQSAASSMRSQRALRPQRAPMLTSTPSQSRGRARAHAQDA